MCMAVQRSCACGNQASLHHLNSVLPDEVVVAVHCPDCGPAAEFDPATMVRDNGWIIQYDMELAAYSLKRHGIEPERVTPEFIFDEGYSTWNGLTPTDSFDKAMEMHELLVQANGDKRRYFEEMKTWTKERTSNLADKGWRKAQAAL